MPKPVASGLAALGDLFWNISWSCWQCHVPSGSYFSDTKATLSKMAGQLVQKKRGWRNCCVFECWVVRLGKQGKEKEQVKGGMQMGRCFLFYL